MTTSTYTVSGMTCAHCASSVTEEVTKIPGVTSVNVDLATGDVQIGSESPVDAADVKSAVEEAGYKLAAA